MQDATGVMLLHNHINGRSGHGLLKFSGLPKILRVDLILLHDMVTILSRSSLVQCNFYCLHYFYYRETPWRSEF